MRRSSLAFVLALLLPSAALADEPLDPGEPAVTGAAPIAAQEGMHAGVGVESTLAGVRGIAFRQGLGPLVSLELVAMADRGPGAYVPGMYVPGDATTVGLAARAIAPLRRGERGVIAVVGGIDLGVRTQEMLDTAYHLAFEGGLRGELFIVDNLSLSLEVGAVLDLPPASGRVLAPEHAINRPDGGATTVSLDNTALAAGAGLTYWFARSDETPVSTDPTERPYLALGASRALSEVAGPAGLFRMTDALDLDVIAGVVKFSGDTEPSSALALVAGVRHTLTRRGAVGLSVGGRAGFAHVGGRAGVDGQTTWLLEAPARIELAATPWLRIHVEGGLAIAVEPGIEGGVEGGGTEGSTAWSLGASGLAAGAGFSIALDR